MDHAIETHEAVTLVTEAHEVQEHLSRFDFEGTLRRVLEAIDTAGLILFARIDHAAGAQKVGLSMPPATVLVYGHPKGGTPLMLAAPISALDLPLRVLVQQRYDGRVIIAFHPASAMLVKAGVPAELAGRLETAQRILVDAIKA